MIMEKQDRDQVRRQEEDYQMQNAYYIAKQTDQLKKMFDLKKEEITKQYVDFENLVNSKVKSLKDQIEKEKLELKLVEERTEHTIKKEDEARKVNLLLVSEIEKKNKDLDARYDVCLKKEAEYNNNNLLLLSVIKNRKEEEIKIEELKSIIKAQENSLADLEMKQNEKYASFAIVTAKINNDYEKLEIEKARFETDLKIINKQKQELEALKKVNQGTLVIIEDKQQALKRAYDFLKNKYGDEIRQ